MTIKDFVKVVYYYRNIGLEINRHYANNLL